MSIWVIVPIPKRVTCRFHTAPCFCWGNYSWDHFRFSLMTKSCADLYWRQMYVVKVVSSWTKLVEGMQDLRLTSARSTWNQSYVRTQICIPDCSTNRIYRVTTYKPKSLSSMSVYFLHIHAHATIICSDGMKNNILAICNVLLFMTRLGTNNWPNDSRWKQKTRQRRKSWLSTMLSQEVQLSHPTHIHSSHLIMRSFSGFKKTGRWHHELAMMWAHVSTDIQV